MKKKYHSKYVEVLNNTSLYIQKALSGDVVPQLDEDKPSWLTSMVSVICEAQADVITATKLNWQIKSTDYKRLALSVLNVPYWIEVIICLNNDLWENLQDFKWGEATQNWSNDVAKIIIDCLDCAELKVPVLQCMVEAWRIADNGANIDLTKWGEQRFDGFCKNLISHIQNHDLYSIEAIKARQNDLQADVKALKTYVWPHFTPTLTRDQYANIFERLQKGKYIDVNTTLEQWLVVCGVDEAGQNYKPVNWIATASLLGVLADTLFDIDRANIWQLVEGAFTIKSKKPNTNTLKNYVSKVDNDYKDKTKGHDDLIRLLQI